MSQQPDHFGAREVSCRQTKEQVDSLGDAAGVGDAAADEIDRNSMLLQKDALDIGQVVVLFRIRNQHGDLVKAEAIAGADFLLVLADERPDFVGDNFGFASNAGAGEKADVRVGSLAVGACSTEARRLPIKDALLKR